MIALIQTAEGALHETIDMLQRMRELSIQASNDTNILDPDREMMQQEIDQLLDEINRHAHQTELNTQKLIDGSFQDKVFHIGANSGQNIKISMAAMDVDGIGLNEEYRVKENRYTVESVTIAKDEETDLPLFYLESLEDGDSVTFNIVKDAEEFVAFQIVDEYYDEASVNGLGIVTGAAEDLVEIDMDEKVDGQTFSGVNISSRDRAEASLEIIDDALDRVNAERSKLGAYQNRLEHSLNSISETIENLNAADSRIRDVDIAKEMMNYTKANVLEQASQSILAHSNQQPESVLALLQ